MYVLDYHRQISLMKEMTVLRKNDEKWEVYYHHPSTNEMWKSYFPRANGEKRGPKILRTEPIPDKLEDGLDICLKGNDQEDAIGFAIELSVSPAKWKKIIQLIDDHYKEYDRQQLKLFFKYLGLFEYEQLFKDLHEEPEHYDLDQKTLKQLGWKARKILIKRFWTW